MSNQEINGAIDSALGAMAIAAKKCAVAVRELNKYYTAKYACKKWAKTIEQCKRKRLPAPPYEGGSE